MRIRSTRFATTLIAGGLFALGGYTAAAGATSEPPASMAPAGPATGCATVPANAAPDIVDTAIAAGGFETLVAAVQAAGLEETLRGEGPFTVFAPTDDAFAALPEGTVDSLLADPQGALTDILTYHVVPGAVLAADVAGLAGQAVTTVNGATFTVNVADDGSVSLTDGAGNQVNVVQTDITASNGVIHVIDAVLMPPASPTTTDVTAAAETTAPAAMDATEAPAATTGGDDTAMAECDIVDTAIAAGGFETLVAAVQAAGLEETLRGEGPFTVFAPTDDAFAALPEGTVDSLLADPQGALTDILTYHVVPGAVLAADVAGLAGQAVTTVNGATFTVNVADDGSVSLTDGAGNQVNVVQTDITASNGVIHVIDAVLMPA